MSARTQPLARDILAGPTQPAARKHRGSRGKTQGPTSKAQWFGAGDGQGLGPDEQGFGADEQGFGVDEQGLNASLHHSLHRSSRSLHRSMHHSLHANMHRNLAASGREDA